MYITWPHLHHTHFVKPFNSCCLKQVLGMFYYDISLYLVWYFNDLVKKKKKSTGPEYVNHQQADSSPYNTPQALQASAWTCCT